MALKKMHLLILGFIFLLGLFLVWRGAAQSGGDHGDDRDLVVKTLETGAPYTVKITSPETLVGLSDQNFGKWVGCSYVVEWGDGDITPAGPIDSSCATGLSHTYKAAGRYKIVARTVEPNPDDSMRTTWEDAVEIDVK